MRYNEEDWSDGRSAALLGRRRRWFASAAYRRGFAHGTRERRAIEQLMIERAANSTDPDGPNGVAVRASVNMNKSRANRLTPERVQELTARHAAVLERLARSDSQPDSKG